MKKLVLPLIALIIGFIAGYYFSESKTTATRPAATGSYTSGTSISREEAQLLVDTFGTRGLYDGDNKPGGKGPKTRSIFMPLTKLDSLVAALDAEKAKDGKTDGIRIYFGRYAKLMPDGKTPYPHPYRNTVIWVSTKDTTVNVRGGMQGMHIHLDYFGAPNQKSAVHLFAIDPQNRGELCPDNCNGAILVCPDPTNPACGE